MSDVPSACGARQQDAVEVGNNAEEHLPQKRHNVTVQEATGGKLLWNLPPGGSAKLAINRQDHPLHHDGQ